jgi:hypothetical protein
VDITSRSRVQKVFLSSGWEFSTANRGRGRIDMRLDRFYASRYMCHGRWPTRPTDFNAMVEAYKSVSCIVRDICSESLVKHLALTG